MKRILFILFVFGFSVINAQAPKKKNSGEIYQSIQKLNFLGTVLYLAAHPDDENTRMISYFSNHMHARTAYLSLTRGDGGQNLIGPEIRELLGVIRTNELLQARRIDGGEQFFTRANDFGYSKHPDETLEIWNEKEVLNDVVRIIRNFQPDIIINRFKEESAGKTHGHHTSSAMLSVKAFDLSANKDYHINNTNPWEIKRMFFNTSWWFYGSKEKFEKADKSKMMSFDTGVYFPSSGLSNTEIASLSRSMHKSQGFGSTGSRGSEMEYLKLIKGEMPDDKANIFEGINTTWTRIKGGNKIKEILDGVEKNFDFKNPSASIPDLVKAYSLIINIEDNYWRKIKEKQIKEIIADCAGLYLEVVSDSPNAIPGDKIKLKMELINRSLQKMYLISYTINNGFGNTLVHQNKNLEYNLKVNLKDYLSISET
ncbi:MAG: LmbE family protein, partial [Bacteroidetes bacterium]